MKLYQRLAARSGAPLSIDEWANYFTFNGVGYQYMPSYSLGGREEEIERSFEGYVRAAYHSNGVVFACMLARLLLFSEARFQFRRMSNGRPGDLFGTPALAALERPWRNGTTGDLLTRAIQDVDLGGNFFCLRPGRMTTDSGRVVNAGDERLRRLRPDWVTVLAGSQEVDETGAGAEVAGYFYHPNGPGREDPIALRPEQVAHFAPIPDPCARFLGMSWLTPVIREVMGDSAAMTHKLKFFENGATPNMVVSLPDTIGQEQFEKWITKFNARYAGTLNAYKTLYLGGGADAKVIGADMRQVSFKETVGAGETRIAAAAGVPPVIVGLSEGLEAATYSNYGQARRRFADGTMRPLWRNLAGSMAAVIDVPPGAELWYDDRDIAFLREDEKDAAEIQQVKASSIKMLIDAGYDPDSVVSAVMAGDLSKLSHTGLYSVQLQPPGTQISEPASNGAAPALNGTKE